MPVTISYSLVSLGIVVFFHLSQIKKVRALRQKFDDVTVGAIR